MIFVMESVAIGYILYSRLFAVLGPGLVVAMAVVLVEGGIFLANGARCPLTSLARRLGDKTGKSWIRCASF